MAYKKVQLSGLDELEQGTQIEVGGYLVWKIRRFALAESEKDKKPLLVLDGYSPETFNHLTNLVFPTPTKAKKKDEMTEQSPDTDSPKRNITVRGTYNYGYLNDCQVVSEPVKEE